MKDKNKKKEKEELLKSKIVDASPLREVIEFIDDETDLIQDIPSKNVNKK